VDTPNVHGTGCTLSAAIAAYLALGHGLEEAIRGAQAFLNRGLRSSFRVGSGPGPVNHLAGLTMG
jgi:hydroxymethylpyrimidine/phosphomethylpyrimidine kinase